MVQVESVFLHAPDAQQRKQLHRLDDDILIAALSLAGGSSIEVATLDEHRAALLGLFGKRDRHGLRRPESAGFLQIWQLISNLWYPLRGHRSEKSLQIGTLPS